MKTTMFLGAVTALMCFGGSAFATGDGMWNGKVCVTEGTETDPPDRDWSCSYSFTYLGEQGNTVNWGIHDLPSESVTGAELYARNYWGRVASDGYVRLNSYNGYYFSPATGKWQNGCTPPALDDCTSSNYYREGVYQVNGTSDDYIIRTLWNPGRDITGRAPLFYYTYKYKSTDAVRTRILWGTP